MPALTILVLVLKVGLLMFLTGGTAALIVRGVRRSRANRVDPSWKEYRGQPGYEASIHGVMPRTPLPEWAYWNDDEDEQNADGDRRSTAT